MKTSSMAQPTQQESSGHPLEDDTPLGANLDFTDPSSPLAPYYVQVSHVVAGIVLAIIFLLYSHFKLFHTDIWAHLKFGQWIVEHQRLPTHEPFSPFSNQEIIYRNVQWLTQTGAYLIYSLGGWLAGGDDLQHMRGGADLLRITHALLATVRYFLLLWAFRRVTGSLPLAITGVIFVFIATLGPGGIQRPQTVGELCFAALLVPLSSPVLARRSFWLVPLLFVLWANCHGSYPIGLMLLTLVGGGRLIEVIHQEGWSLLGIYRDAQCRRLLVVLLLSLGAIALLNPHGPMLYWHTVAVSRHANIPTVVEWQPLNIPIPQWNWREPFALNLTAGGHWIYGISLGLLLLTAWVSPRPLSPTRILLVITFGVWPCLQQRMMVWWLLLFPWVVLPSWVAVGQRLSWSWLHYQSTPCFRKTLLLGWAVGVVLLCSRPVAWVLARQPAPFTKAVSPATPWKVTAQLKAPFAGRSNWLPELARVLRERYPKGKFTGRVYASETLGDYLVWALPAEYPVLIYNHAHLFPVNHWQDCLAVKAGQPLWWEVLDRHRVNLVVIEPGLHPTLTRRLRTSPEWEIVLDQSAPWNAQNRWERILVAVRKTPLVSDDKVIK